MRMWMINPKLMCRNHLLGEHLEIHMFVGTINEGKSLDGYIKNGLLEFSKLRERHDELVEEMKTRGYNHKSPLQEIKMDVSETVAKSKVNRRRNKSELFKRCFACFERYVKMK